MTIRKTLGLVLLATAGLFASCLKEGDKTIVLPARESAVPTSVVADSLQSELEREGFIINRGNTPPDVRGSYLASPLELVYASDGYTASEFHDLRLSFTDQTPRGAIHYSEGQADTVVGTSSQARIIGDGNAFTMFCLQDVTSASGVWLCRVATLVSGIKENNGLRNLRYAIVTVDTRAVVPGEPLSLAPKGTIRIFRDGDDLATNL